ncbi:MAG TPA: metal-dependent hydrolase [Chitinophagaceae bacterium]|nr:metal-dependent hydrolase [Chitinophagaceae bacterium]
MELTYFGQSCFSVVIGGKHLLFDPFITGNELARDILVDGIPADYILLTHGHTDHVADAEFIAKRTGAHLIANDEIVNWFAAKGLTNLHPMNHGGSLKKEFGTVKMVAATHSSSMPDGSYGGNAGGFLVTSPEGNFYFAGDTALTMDMSLIPRFAKLDFAVLPVGDNYTMGYEDALLAAEMVQCKKVVAVHYDTFPLIRIDREKVRTHFQKAGYELLMPRIGETIQT